MTKLLIDRFKKGKWCQRSNSLLGDKKKVAALLLQSARYVNKSGMKEVRQELDLLRTYISDILKGHYKGYDNYKGYDKSSLTLSFAAIIYVVSPLDLVPDFVPLGLFDDVSIVLWAVSQLSGEFEKYKQQRIKQEKDSKTEPSTFSTDNQELSELENESN